MSTAYHPQTDGSTERVNRTVIQILRNFTNTRQSDWSSHLSRVEFAINFAPSESTGTSPFETNSGKQPLPMPDLTTPVSANPHADNFVKHMTRIHQTVFNNITKSRSKQKEQADKRRRESPPYKVGDQVLVSSEILLPKTTVRSKLSSRFQGPFTVTKVASHDTFDLDLPKDWNVHRRFHTSVLKPYHNNDNTLFPSRSHERPPPVQAEHTSEPQYEVEEIRDHRIQRNKHEYRVHWKGYPDYEDSWVRLDDINAPDLLRQFHAKHPKARPSSKKRRM